MEAIQSFAEDIYFCSLEHGPRDVRTTLGYYNIAKIFESQVKSAGRLCEAGKWSGKITGCSDTLQHCTLGYCRWAPLLLSPK